MTDNILFIFLHLFAYLTVVLSATGNDHKTYIIHMDPSAKPAPFSTHESWHSSLLHSLSANEVAATHLYSYNHVLNGFSASLSSSQLDILKQMPGHIAVFPETYGTVHTTHTPKYLGLSHKSGIWPVSNYGAGVIIGVIDTGIWPESKSFLDKGMAPVPSRWKGKCEEGVNFTSSLCNRKLIGARSFSKSIRQPGNTIPTARDYDSARDFFGHGTHTSSTAAGSPVRDASYFGYAEGTMTGIAPKAHVAMYKALFYDDSDSKGTASDVLAAMDQAIEDGVDVMSISLGFLASPFYEDVVAIGAFAAMKKGIFVSVSAGNRGPRAYTVINSAPWFTSVGAGTIDRDYTAAVHLRDGASGIHFSGRSIFPLNLFVSNASFYFGAGNYDKGTCNYLVPSEVVGKFVFCAAGNRLVTHQMTVVDKSGAKGAIFATGRGQFLFPNDFNRPYLTVSLEEGEEIEQYLSTKATGTVTVDIKFIQTTLGFKPAPQVPYYSSRGPSLITPCIMKPDILAPGVNVLSSWVPNRGWVLIGDDTILADYVLLYGTSMAAPHIAGVAALVKSVHPDWTPAAVRSAMMTTAGIVDNTGGTIMDMNISSAGTPLDFGAGHVNPNEAMDPGLVYDIGYEDYLNFVCGLNYTDAQKAVITGRPGYDCSKVNLDLNYPAFMVVLNNNTNVSSQVFTRVLTSVVDYPASYSVTVYEPNGMKVTVQPLKLYFEGKGSKAEYLIKVDVDLNNHTDKTKARNHIGNYGFISWNEIGGKHKVRSPVVSTVAP